MTAAVPLHIVEQTLNQQFGADELFLRTSADDGAQAKICKSPREDGRTGVYVILTVEPGEITGTAPWSIMAGELAAQCLAQTSPMPGLTGSAGAARALPSMLAPNFVTAVEHHHSQATRPDLVHQLRKLSGLTWEQLACLVGVTRRTLHNWANGLPMARSNEERLARTLSALHAIDRGSARANRAFLFTVAPAGATPFDLLSREDYGSVIDLARDQQAAHVPMSETQFAIPGPKPLSPSVLADAREDRIHKSPEEPSRWVSTSRTTKSERK